MLSLCYTCPWVLKNDEFVFELRVEIELRNIDHLATVHDSQNFS